MKRTIGQEGFATARIILIVVVFGLVVTAGIALTRDSSLQGRPAVNAVRDEGAEENVSRAVTRPDNPQTSQATSYKTVREALNSGLDLKCEWAQETPTGRTTSTYYFANGRIRIETHSQANSQYAILTDKNLYTWNDVTSKVRSYPVGYGTAPLSGSVSLYLQMSLQSHSCAVQMQPDSIFLPQLN